MTTESTEYEKLVQELYKEIMASEGHTSIDVKHNVEIKGKSGCEHQIDIYWEFKVAGETHRVGVNAYFGQNRTLRVKSQ